MTKGSVFRGSLMLQGCIVCYEPHNNSILWEIDGTRSFSLFCKREMLKCVLHGWSKGSLVCTVTSSTGNYNVRIFVKVLHFNYNMNPKRHPIARLPRIVEESTSIFHILRVL